MSIAESLQDQHLITSTNKAEVSNNPVFDGLILEMDYVHALTHHRTLQNRLFLFNEAREEFKLITCQRVMQIVRFQRDVLPSYEQRPAYLDGTCFISDAFNQGAFDAIEYHENDTILHMPALIFSQVSRQKKKHVVYPQFLGIFCYSNTGR